MLKWVANKENEMVKMIFLTGLSGAGKSTIAEALQKNLQSSEVIDGDRLRQIYKNDLPHGSEGRERNLQRLIEQTISLSKAKRYIISAFVSPDASLRDRVKKAVEKEGMDSVEVYIKASVETCKERDVKGLYARCRNGEDIKLAGLNEPYQEPKNPSITCLTDDNSVQKNVSEILNYLKGTNS